MGVNIGSVVSRHEIGFGDLKHKIVGVDAYNALYQFLSSIRGYDGSYLMDEKGNVTSHLQGLFNRTLNLMSKGVKLVYVFDGEPPKLKFSENEFRKERKAIAEAKFVEASDDDNLDEMYKYSKQFMKLTKNMVEESKKLISAMGLPVVQAPSEAEGQVAYLCREGLVDYSASQDYDSLLFGAPRLVRNLTLSQKRRIRGGKTVFTFLELVKLDEVLKELQLNQEQLIALGILCGTDFNVGGVKGFGPKKALKLVKEYKNFEQFDKMFNNLNVEFKWNDVYDIFVNLPVTKNVKLRWDEVNNEKVKKVLVKDHDFNEERVQSSLDKYRKENKNSNQKGLGEFFN